MVGYLRWSMEARYAPPRLLAYKIGPHGELLEGLTDGPPFALAVGAVMGDAPYPVGYGFRRFVR